MNNLQLIKSNLTNCQKTLSIIQQEETVLQLQRDTLSNTSSKLIQEFKKQLLTIKKPNLNKLDSVSFDRTNHIFKLDLNNPYSKLYFRNIQNTYDMLVSKINSKLEDSVLKKNIFWLVYQLDFTNGNLKPFTKINKDLTFSIYQNSLDLTDSNLLVENINSEPLNFTHQFTNYHHNLLDILTKENKIHQDLNDIIVLWKNNNLWDDNIELNVILEEIKSREIEIKKHEEFKTMDFYYTRYLQNEKYMEKNKLLLEKNLQKKIELHNTHKQLTLNIKLLKNKISNITPSCKKMLDRNKNIITKKVAIPQDKYNIEELLLQQTNLQEKLIQLQNVLRDTKINMDSIDTKLETLNVTIKQSDGILLVKYNLQKENFLHSRLKLELQLDKTQLEIKNTQKLLSFLEETILTSTEQQSYKNKSIENKTIKVDYCEVEYQRLKLELKDFLVSSQNLQKELEQLKEEIKISQDKTDMYQERKEKYFKDIKSNALWLVFQDRLLLLDLKNSCQKYKSLKKEELEIKKNKTKLLLKEYQIEDYSESFNKKNKLSQFIIKLGEVRYYILQLVYLWQVSEFFSLKIDIEKFWEPIMLDYDVTKKIIEYNYHKEVKYSLEQYENKRNNLVRDYYFKLVPLSKEINNIISKKLFITEKINNYKLLEEDLLELYNYMLNTDTYNFI